MSTTNESIFSQASTAIPETVPEIDCPISVDGPRFSSELGQSLTDIEIEEEADRRRRAEMLARLQEVQDRD